MEQWTLQHRVFVYDAFVRNGKPVTAAQRLFQKQFNVGRHGAVPSWNTILRWVANLTTTGNSLRWTSHTALREAVHGLQAHCLG